MTGFYRRADRGATLGNFIKVFPLIITALFSPNNLLYIIETRAKNIPGEILSPKVDKVDVTQSVMELTLPHHTTPYV